ncbi:MAG: tetratricopeptide repeat protein [Planctomycetes bacterium]|nr:tetratricopeptide repeat protein [Planctomycetota bacterium]
MVADPNEDRLDAGLKAAFRSQLQSIVVKIGTQPISLRDESVGLAPLVTSRTVDVPSGREGRYQVLGEIARGGMGIVMRGHDVDLGRDVAMKILREDHSTKPDVVQRFVEEAQIGGQLQHPGIVPVYELGQRADQRPFFTMKLVKGKTLAALLADRTDPMQDRRRFLAIFEAVCQTMAYAHARGVIHRDLKPANVMVGAFGEVQVVDWGMGKVLGQGGIADERNARSRAAVSIIATVRSESQGSDSLVGSVMGTPAYMPPEQARGAVNDLDERCDVFSLGAILCEIVTGQPPYVGDALTKAVNADLTDAYARLDGCGADDDLVRLAKSCLVPAPIARPKDASVLAAAIGAHLASVEERAQKAQLEAAEATVKASEERRRRKLSLALAAAVVAFIVLGGGGWLAIESAHRERIAETTHAVSQALDEATLLKGKAEASDELEPWQDAVSAAKRAEALAESRDADVTTRARVHDLMASLQSGEQAANAKTEQRAKDKEMIDRLDDVRATLSDQFVYATADEQYAQAFRAYGIDIETLAVGDAVKRVKDSAIGADLIIALDDWIDVLPSRGRKHDWAVTVVKASDDDPWRAQLRNANSVEDQHRLAEHVDLEKTPIDSLVRLVHRLGIEGDTLRAASLSKDVARRHPGDFWALFAAGYWADRSHPAGLADAVTFYTAAVAVRPRSLPARNNLGNALRDKGDFDGAIAEHREVIRVQPDRAMFHSNLGRELQAKGDFGGAVAEFKWAIRLQPNDAYDHDMLGVALMSRDEPYGALAEFREAIRLEPGLATARVHLGKALTDEGDPNGPITAAREVVLLAPNDAAAHVHLGLALADGHDLDRAIEEYREATRLKPDLADAHVDLAISLAAKGDGDGAISEYRAAIRLDPTSAEAHSNLGAALQAKGDLDGAIAECREATRLKPDRAETHYNLGRALQAKGDPDGAIAEASKAIQLEPDMADAHILVAEALVVKGDLDGAITEDRAAILIKPNSSVAHNDLAWILATAAREDLRNPDEAVRLARRAVELRPNEVGPLNTLGIALYRHGDLQEAVSTLNRSMELGKGGCPEDWFFLAMAHQKLGKADEARRWYQRAVEQIEKESSVRDDLGRFRIEAEHVLEIGKEHR